jgi:putative intracellular protease/amidase
MRVYLGSGVLQSAVADFFAQEKPVGAICHGVLLAALSGGCGWCAVCVGAAARILEIQRNAIVPVAGAAGRQLRTVGGFIQLTSVTADGISSRIIHRWSDRIGDKLPHCEAGGCIDAL